MPSYEIELWTIPEGVRIEPPVAPTAIERAVMVASRGLQLRRLDDAETHFDVLGKYKEAWAVLPNVKAEGVAELISFEADEKHEGDYGGSIRYQLSGDGGTTWRVWQDTTGAWEAATGGLANTYNNLATVNRRFAQFPFASLPEQRQMRVKTKLFPSSDGAKTPLLMGVRFLWELRYNFQEDLARSIKRFLEGSVGVRRTLRDRLPTGVPPQTSYEIGQAWRAIAEPIAVYDVDADPQKTTNKFLSITLPRTVVFAPIPAGRAIEIQYVARPMVFLAADENFEISTLPSIVLEMPSVSELRKLRRTVIVEKQIEAAKARMRAAPVFLNATIRARCQSTLKHEALEMADAVLRLVDQRRCSAAYFHSIASGESMTILQVTSLGTADQVAKKLYVSDVSMVVNGKAWAPEDYIEVFLAREIITNVRASGGSVEPVTTR